MDWRPALQLEVQRVWSQKQKTRNGPTRSYLLVPFTCFSRAQRAYLQQHHACSHPESFFSSQSHSPSHTHPFSSLITCLKFKLRNLPQSETDPDHLTFPVTITNASRLYRACSSDPPYSTLLHASRRRLHNECTHCQRRQGLVPIHLCTFFALST